MYAAIDRPPGSWDHDDDGVAVTEDLFTSDHDS